MPGRSGVLQLDCLQWSGRGESLSRARLQDARMVSSKSPESRCMYVHKKWIANFEAARDRVLTSSHLDLVGQQTQFSKVPCIRVRVEVTPTIFFALISTQTLSQRCELLRCEVLRTPEPTRTKQGPERAGSGARLTPLNSWANQSRLPLFT